MKDKLREECESYVRQAHPTATEEELKDLVEETMNRLSAGPRSIALKALPREKYIECQCIDTTTGKKCGIRLRSLKVHLARAHGWYEHDYRNFTGLPADIPLVCGELSKRRREIVNKVNAGYRRPGNKKRKAG